MNATAPSTADTAWAVSHRARYEDQSPGSVVVADVLAHIGEHLSERIPDSAAPRQRLRAYVSASIDYIRAHSAEMSACWPSS